MPGTSTPTSPPSRTTWTRWRAWTSARQAPNERSSSCGGASASARTSSNGCRSMPVHRASTSSPTWSGTSASHSSKWASRPAFATDAPAYEIQFGTIDRPTHQNTSWEEAAFEVPAQRWADLSDAHYGVALLADCKHGYIVREDTLWLSLLKGAIDPDPDADRGQHHFTYSLLPHAAGLDGVRRAAYGLTRPLMWRREGAHAGSLPSR